MAATVQAVTPPPNLKQSSDFWDLSRRSLAAQRAGRYVPDRKEDPDSLKAGRTWPDVAGAIIDTYSKPGDWMLAPMCGTGVELVEATWRARNVVGLEIEELRLRKAIEHLRWGELHDAPGYWSVKPGDARDRELLSEEMWVTPPLLIFLDPPFGETRQDGGKNHFGSVLHNYTGEDRIKSRAQRDQSNLGNMKLPDYLAAMQRIFDNCLHVAADGAYMAVLSKDYRKHFRRIDLLGELRLAGETAGWRYFDRAVIYLGRASHQQQRNAKANGNLLPITQDLLVFRKE